MAEDAELQLADGTTLKLGTGTVPARSAFQCQACGQKNDFLEATKGVQDTAPAFPHVLQCHCPDCAKEGQAYGGRYFKRPDDEDCRRFSQSVAEWHERSVAGDLRGYSPTEPLAPAYMTHKLNGGIPNWGYTHWWKMFNHRQLLGHAQLLKTITEAEDFPLEVREQALGAFQQYLRNQNMFCFWNSQRDTLEPMFANPNYHPKATVIENAFFHRLGRGNWTASVEGVLEGLTWSQSTWDVALPPGAQKSERVSTGEVGKASRPTIQCGSATDLGALASGGLFDLAITDPPFGNNVFYADLADFFYVWLRIPMMRWYAGKPEAAFWQPARTPRAAEAVDNAMEHPDDREPWQQDRLIKRAQLETIRLESGNAELQVGHVNPCWRPEPSSAFYREVLTAAWAESHRVLKPGGMLAFTFHHKDDEPWVEVLQSLFDAGFVLVATYPVRSDETKGDNAAFGAKAIEYDIIHVCRKRLQEPVPVAYQQMRRWVKEEAAALKRLLDDAHAEEGGLPPNDLRIILIGKSLEFFSRHYGQVVTGHDEKLGVREALLGVNLLLDDLLGSGGGEKDANRPPDDAEPTTRLFLKLFANNPVQDKDTISKGLRGTGFGPENFISRGWCTTSGGDVERVSLTTRFRHLTAQGRNRKVLKSDLDQANFCAGACLLDSHLDLTQELEQARTSQNWVPKKHVPDLLRWMARNEADQKAQLAAQTAATLLSAWLEKAPTGAPAQSAQPELFPKPYGVSA